MIACFFTGNGLGQESSRDLVKKVGKFKGIHFTYDGGSLIFVFGQKDASDKEIRIVLAHPDSPLNAGRLIDNRFNLLISDNERLVQLKEITHEVTPGLLEALQQQDSVVTKNLTRLIESLKQTDYEIYVWGREAVEVLSKPDGEIGRRASLDTSSKKARVCIDSMGSKQSWLVSTGIAELTQSGFDCTASTGPTCSSSIPGEIFVTIRRVSSLGAFPKGGFVIVVGPSEVSMHCGDSVGGEQAAKRLGQIFYASKGQLEIGIYSNLPLLK
jgi:hypothetical protein